MVFYRKRGGKRPYKKKLAAKVATLAKRVRAQAPENKYVDHTFTANQFNYTPTVSYAHDLTASVPVGTSDISRVGDNIRLKYIDIRGLLTNTTVNPFNGRIIVVRCKYNLESLITTTNAGNLIMDSNYSSGVNAYNAPLDNDNSYGIKVLWDYRFNINPSSNLSGVSTSMTQQRMFRKRIPINANVEYYHGTTTNVKNGIYAFLISESATSTGQYVHWVARMHYIDP